MRHTAKFDIVFLFVALAAAAAVFATVFLVFMDSPGSAKKVFSDVKSFSPNWKTQYGLTMDISRLSQRLSELSPDEPVYLSKTLPDDCGGCAMLFRVNNLVVNVSVGGEVVSYAAPNGRSFGMPTFQTYRLIRFDEDDAGKELRFEIYSTPFSFKGCIDNIYYGDGASLIVQEVTGSVFVLALSCVLFVAGLFFVCIGILTRNVLEHCRGMVFFGLFDIFISMWFVSGSPWAYLFTNSIRAIDTGFWLYLITAMMFGMLYIYEVFRIVHSGLFKTALCLCVVLISAVIALMWTEIAQPGELVFLQHVFLVICALIVLVEMISFLSYNRGNKEKNKIFNFGVILFVLFGLCDICRFYQGNGGDSSAMTRIGAIVFTVTAAACEIREAIALLELGIKAGKIGKIAYTDANTGLGNPAAFKAKMESLEITKTNYSYIGIIQFDVNNLKIVNDTKGHEAGDLLIKTAANIIDRSFGAIGTCYRVGGDEFVAITTYNHAPVACEEAIVKFESLIEQFDRNPSRPFDLRIAYGVAYYQNTVNRYVSLKEIHKIADERMYNKKKELKARYAKTPEEAVIR